MQRRAFILALGTLLAPSLALAQARTVRIGFLAPRPRPRVVSIPPILKRLAELGYVEGKNLIVEYRSSDGVMERFPSLARELIEAKCDVIIAVGIVQAARALIDEKASVPIVILGITCDPVQAGIVPNLQRPGANITGVHFAASALAAKRLEILSEVVPKAKRYLVLADPQTTEQLEGARQAAQRLQLEVVPITFEKPPYDFESAFEQGRKAKVEALLLPDSAIFLAQRERIGELALKHRMPAAAPAHYFDSAANGLLFGYGANLDRTSARAADIAASILRGKKPGDIPVEQPTEFEFVINLKTVKALGISLPGSVVVRADRVIE